MSNTTDERWKRWAKRHPERANARMREWRQRNPKYMLRVSAKRRASEKGLEFDLSIEDIPDIPDFCPIAGIPIHQRADGKKGPIPNSPTLDRVDQTRGYTKDNIRVISFKANKWKSDMTLEEIKNLYEYTLGIR